MSSYAHAHLIHTHGGLPVFEQRHCGKFVGGIGEDKQHDLLNDLVQEWADGAPVAVTVNGNAYEGYITGASWPSTFCSHTESVEGRFFINASDCGDEPTYGAAMPPELSRLIEQINALA